MEGNRGRGRDEVKYFLLGRGRDEVKDFLLGRGLSETEGIMLEIRTLGAGWYIYKSRR